MFAVERLTRTLSVRALFITNRNLTKVVGATVMKKVGDGQQCPGRFQRFGRVTFRRKKLVTRIDLHEWMPVSR